MKAHLYSLLFCAMTVSTFMRAMESPPLGLVRLTPERRGQDDSRMEELLIKREIALLEYLKSIQATRRAELLVKIAEEQTKKAGIDRDIAQFNYLQGKDYVVIAKNLKLTAPIACVAAGLTLTFCYITAKTLPPK